MIQNHTLGFLVSLMVTVSLSSFAFAKDNVATPFLPEVLNPDGRMTLTPGFSPEGKTMYFAQTECLPIWECPQTLKRIERTQTGWSEVQSVKLPSTARVDYPSVSPDGRYLLFSWATKNPAYEGRDVSTNFDLWRADLTEVPLRPEPLQGTDLNRLRAGTVKTLRFVNNETAPHLTRDGDLYFWSERLGAIGERDVFLAKPDGEGGFKAPEPLPAPINSKARDNGSWVSPDGLTMLINYSDRGGCGGSDIFIAYKTDDLWSEPQNLGCEINSSYDEYGAAFIPNTQTIVFPSLRPSKGVSEGTVQLWQADLP